MKRGIAFLLFFVLMTSFAFADSFSFIEAWNKAASVYGAPELSEIFMIRNPGCYGWKTDDWELFLYDLNSDLDSIDLYAEKTDDFLRLAVMAGNSAVTFKTADTHQQYLANILNMYLRISAGMSSRTSSYDTLIFEMEIVEGRYHFHAVNN